MQTKIQRALISVSDKPVSLEFAQALAGLGVEIAPFHRRHRQVARRQRRQR